MIRQLDEQQRPNGTLIVTVIVTDPDEGAHHMFEVRCDVCGDRRTEDAGGLTVEVGNLAQLDSEAEAIAVADEHLCLQE